MNLLIILEKVLSFSPVERARRRQEYYYFDIGWGTLIHFPASVDKFVTFPIHFSNFGKGTFPLFPHPGGAYGAISYLKTCDSLAIVSYNSESFQQFLDAAQNFGQWLSNSGRNKIFSLWILLLL